MDRGPAGDKRSCIQRIGHLPRVPLLLRASCLSPRRADCRRAALGALSELILASLSANGSLSAASRLAEAAARWHCRWRLPSRCSSIPRSSAGSPRRLALRRRPWRAAAHLVAKQPLAIATLPRFQAFGFVERVAHPGLPTPPAGSCFAAAGLLRSATCAARRRPVPHPVVRPLPALRPGRAQAVDSLPLLNAAVLPFRARELLAVDPGPALAAGRGAAELCWPRSRRCVERRMATCSPVRSARPRMAGTAPRCWRLHCIGCGAASPRARVTCASSGLALLTGVTFKVFLIDAAALDERCASSPSGPRPCADQDRLGLWPVRRQGRSRS